MVKETAGKSDEPPRSSKNDARTTATSPRLASAPRTRPHGSCSNRLTRSRLPAVSSGKKIRSRDGTKYEQKMVHGEQLVLKQKSQRFVIKLF